MPTIERRREMPPVFFLLLAVAFGLYVAMLASITTPGQSGGGEAAIGAAYQELLLTFALWVVLAILLLIGGLIGEMPRWAATLAIFLHPLAGVATVVAIDMCSREVGGAIVFPAFLPLLVGFYAAWARLPQLRRLMPPISVPALGAVLVFSVAPLLLALYY